MVVLFLPASHPALGNKYGIALCCRSSCAVICEKEEGWEVCKEMLSKLIQMPVMSTKCSTS